MMRASKQLAVAVAACALLPAGIFVTVVEATPLHGLGTVFRSQTPDAYRQSVRQVVKNAELRSGSIEDLQRRADAAKSSSNGPTASKPAPASKPSASPTRRPRIGGKIEGRNTGRATVPSLIARPVQDGATKTFTANLQGAPGAELRMQALELVEVLAYFNAENVNWDGHMGLNCDYAGFLQAAREMLPEFGAVGVEAVVQAIGEELTGVTIPREVRQNPMGYVSVFNSVYQGQASNPLTRDRQPVQEQGLSNEKIVQRTLLVNPSYHKDLLALLRYFERQNMLTPQMKEHLKMCSAGQKPAELKGFAEGVKAILGMQGLEPDATVLQMLQALEESEDRKTIEQLRRRLDAASPRYSEVKNDLAEIWEFVESDNTLAASAATAQVENAFWRAPISECLIWMGQQGAERKKLIWHIIDQRIARARAEAPERLPQYRDTALAALTDQDVATATQQAALELLVRLKDSQSVAPLVRQLLVLRRELWPAAGQTLRELTGQDFGPRAGDGLVEAKLAQDKWQRWLKSQ